MQIQVSGIVIKETDSGEKDRYITILTDSHGAIEAFVKGARGKGSKFAVSTSLFCYSKFELFYNKSKYYVDQADVINVFYDIRYDLQRLSLASYFCQILCEIKPQGDNTGDVLKLMLNSMHLLANTKKDARIIKAVFELRVMELSGFSPNLVACEKCGEFDKLMRFYIAEGSIICNDCLSNSNNENNNIISAQLTPAVLSAMRYILYSEPAKVFAFTLDDDNLKLLNEVCESYLVWQTERNYKSLEFLKTMIN